MNIKSNFLTINFNKNFTDEDVKNNPDTIFFYKPLTKDECIDIYHTLIKEYDRYLNRDRTPILFCGLEMAEKLKSKGIK